MLVEVFLAEESVDFPVVVELFVGIEASIDVFLIGAAV